MDFHVIPYHFLFSLEEELLTNRTLIVLSKKGYSVKEYHMPQNVSYGYNSYTQQYPLD